MRVDGIGIDPPGGYRDIWRPDCPWRPGAPPLPKVSIRRHKPPEPKSFRAVKCSGCGTTKLEDHDCQLCLLVRREKAGRTAVERRERLRSIHQAAYRWADE